MPFQVGSSSGVPAGSYKGQLLRVEPPEAGKFGEQRKWFFLVDVDGTAVEHLEWTSTNVSPKSKAYMLLKGLLGRDLRAGEEIEEPTGKTAILNFTPKRDQAGELTGYNGISSVTPIVEPVQTEAGIPR